MRAFQALHRPQSTLTSEQRAAVTDLTAKTGIDATKVHAVFYRLAEKIDRPRRPPQPVFSAIRDPDSLKGVTLLVDESSMISKAMASDILRTGITVAAVGDPGQLPPVEGSSFFTKASFTLTEIHRQAFESPTIRQAHAVRVGGHYEADGAAVRVITRLTGDELRAAEVVITGRCQTRMRMNAEKRRVLGLHNPLPRQGEPLICLRNGQCNGAIYYASRDLEEGDETVGISTDDGDVEVPTIFLGPGHEYDRPELAPWQTVFAFAYPQTVHQSQGSEFDSVLFIDEWFRSDRHRWLYTGLTGAKERITVASKDQPS
jgi:exodeoxyribonuclease-5